ncbi:HAD family phosphatase [Cellulomonas sp. NPDC089187]|uniref:HAD family hydrolase n=1 Tax=Cellulomonas sp. NPDC089187 TaxID=3154970 RepID=UPI003424BCCD
MTDQPTTSAVLWDMDGVLVDSEALLYEAERQLFAEHGIGLTPQVKAGFVGLGGTEVLAALAGHYGIEPDLPAWTARKIELATALFPQLQPFAPTTALVRALAAAQVPMAVASGSPLSAIEVSLSTVGLAELLPVRVSVDQVGAGKPAPDVFLAAAERLGVPPEQCVVIEDAVPGVLAAKAAGMRCIAIPSVIEPLDPRFEQADLLIRGGMATTDANDLLDWMGFSTDRD